MTQLDAWMVTQIAVHYPTRERFLSELTLDAPEASGDFAGPPHMDEDFLVLSTIHSAKGQEWHSVHILNVADGNFPSEFSTGREELIEEERRLLYVAMTRAKDHRRSDGQVREARPCHRRGRRGIRDHATGRRRRHRSPGARHVVDRLAPPGRRAQSWGCGRRRPGPDGSAGASLFGSACTARRAVRSSARHR